MPYDRFARELLASSGSNFRVRQVNFYRAVESQEPEVIAQAAALALMGERAEKWPGDRLEDMGVFFSKIGFKETSEWKEEIVFFDSLKKTADAGASATSMSSIDFVALGVLSEERTSSIVAPLQASLSRMRMTQDHRNELA